MFQMLHNTKRLGYRYLWIDSLIIIQDSYETGRMSRKYGHIYKASSLTILLKITKQLYRIFEKSNEGPKYP